MMKNIKQLFTHKAKNYIVLGAGFALAGAIGIAQSVHEKKRIERNVVGGCLLLVPTQECPGYLGTYSASFPTPSITIGSSCGGSDDGLILVNCPASTPSHYWDSPYSTVGLTYATNLYDPYCPNTNATKVKCEGVPGKWTDVRPPWENRPSCSSTVYTNAPNSDTVEGPECGSGS
jgi:hypothetical protein